MLHRPAGARRHRATDAHNLPTDANTMMTELHDRMPVILEQNYWLVWLGKVEGDLTALLKPAADNVLKAWPVRRREFSEEQRGGVVGAG
jgi:putative SOS response-associated peptidase YedK